LAEVCPPKQVLKVINIMIKNLDFLDFKADNTKHLCKTGPKEIVQSTGVGCTKPG
jgi:hypothetical protein